jgi:hypothetical protein
MWILFFGGGTVLVVGCITTVIHLQISVTMQIAFQICSTSPEVGVNCTVCASRVCNLDYDSGQPKSHVQDLELLHRLLQSHEFAVLPPPPHPCRSRT